MAAINEINKKPVHTAKAYVARAKKEVVPAPVRVRTTEEIVNEVPFINEPRHAIYRQQLIQYLDSPDLRGLLGQPNSNEGFNGRPWTRNDMVLFYTGFVAGEHRRWLSRAKEREEKAKEKEKRKAELAERKKNWNPTDADKLKFMVGYMGLRNKMPNTQATKMDTFCTCCGMLHVVYPGLDTKRMRWEVVADGAEMHSNHNKESLRIKDAETGKDMIISWDNE